MTKCKECDLYEENKLLKENLNISQHFHEILGMKWTGLRVKMRAWGIKTLPIAEASTMVSPSWADEFWLILGEETPAERFEKQSILASKIEVEK